MIRNAIQRFMYGRYGSDQLNICLVVSYLVLYFLSAIFRSQIFHMLSLAVVGVCLFRTLSRNYPARRKENAQFLKIAGPALSWLRTKRCMMKDHDHRYFRCPKCGQQLRVPKGKGNITVSCRSCGNRFQEKS